MRVAVPSWDRSGAVLGRIAVVVLLTALAACGADSGAQASDGPRVFRHDPDPDADFADAVVKGLLSYDEEQGCFLLTLDEITYPVVWPAGTEGLTAGPSVKTPQGRVLTVGDTVTGSGGYFQADSDYISEVHVPPDCLPPSGEVAVFNVNEVIPSP